jgi:hypothetical protein
MSCVHSRRLSGNSRFVGCSDSLEQRRRLPYGVYLCWDGSAVIFDRRYQPRYRRALDGTVRRDDPGRRVHGIRGNLWFYNDDCSPRVNLETLRRITIIQRRWEAAVAGAYVALADLLPAEWIVNSSTKKAA